MSLKQQIDQDLKQAMLAGDKMLVTTLRGLKSAILNEEVAKGVRETGLPDDDIVNLFTKEAKKRQESADLFKQGGNDEKASQELAEKEVINNYLPEQMSEEDLAKLVDVAIASMGKDPAKMGQIIGAVKQKAGAGADGAAIASLVKQRLQ
ncbi:hypothetical protein A3D14_01735 [Candidatus Saccharibacteria bacterium RIFCSPHIGHO2_02_FULL_47_12]|nr:MAG: hypothetical protein A3D14_01735 [Candidatus Saccharibacteria bacterium RIFCSPHIGHO2_02_FULL_47_12]